MNRTKFRTRLALLNLAGAKFNRKSRILGAGIAP